MTTQYQPHTVLRAAQLVADFAAKADLDPLTGKLLLSELPGGLAQEADLTELTEAVASNADAITAAHDLAQSAKSEADANTGALATKADLSGGKLAAGQVNLVAGDGTTSIDHVTSLTFAGGATITGSAGNAIVTLPAGGGAAPGVRPSLDDMTWLAQGTSTARDVPNGPLVLVLATAPGTQIRGGVWPLNQSGAYTVKAHLRTLSPADNYFGQGIILASDTSSNPKLSMMAEVYGNRGLMQHQYYQDPADIYSTTKSIGWSSTGELYLAAYDDLTNIYWCVSVDDDSYSVYRVTPRGEYFVAGAYGAGGSCCDSPASGPTTGMSNEIEVHNLRVDPGCTIQIN